MPDSQFLNLEPRTLNPARPGRPRFLDEIKRSQLIAIVANGCGLTAAANYIGCHPRTIRRECCGDPQFREQLKRAELDGQLEPINNLRAASKKHWRAAAWLLERSRPYAFCPTKSDVFSRDDLHELIDGINSVITKNHPDAQAAAQLIEHIEDYLTKKSEKLLTEDPKEKRRRAAGRHTPPPTTSPEFEADSWLEDEAGDEAIDDDVSEDAEQDADEVRRTSEETAPTSRQPAAHSFPLLDLQSSRSTVTVHPIYPTPEVTQLTKLREFCHHTATQTLTISRCAPQTTKTKCTNIASPCGTPRNPDKTDRTPTSERLPSSPPSAQRHAHHPNQPYSPVTSPHAPIPSPSQTQIVPPRPKVRRVTKRRFVGRLNELEMQVHRVNIAVARVAAMLEHLAAPDQPARPIGFCPCPPTPQHRPPSTDLWLPPTASGLLQCNGGKAALARCSKVCDSRRAARGPIATTAGRIILT
jgi:hypothetical protein